MAFDPRTLIPLVATGLQPNGGGGFLKGWQRAQQEMDARRQQEQQQARLTAQDDRAQQQLMLQSEQHEWQRQQQQLQAVNSIRQLLEDPNIDDPAVFDQRLAFANQFAPKLGVDPGFIQSLRPAPTVFQQRQAKKKLAEIESDPQIKKLLESGEELTVAFELPQMGANPSRPDGRPLWTRTELMQLAQRPTPSAPLPKPATRTPDRALQRVEVMIDGKPAFASFDPDTGKYTDTAGQDVTARVTPPPPDRVVYPAPAGTERPLTQGQRAQIIGSRRSQWQRFSKAVTDRQQAVSKVDSGLAALDRGNRNAATQAIVLAFNKLQDETSVVREGEYARSEDLAPILSRIEGAFVKITAGGGALTDADLRALAFEAKETAKALEAITNEAAANLRQGIEEELADYHIPPSRVFGGSRIGIRGTAPQPTAPTAPPPSSPQRPASGGRIGRFEIVEVK